MMVKIFIAYTYICIVMFGNMINQPLFIIIRWYNGMQCMFYYVHVKDVYHMKSVKVQGILSFCEIDHHF